MRGRGLLLPALALAAAVLGAGGPPSAREAPVEEGRRFPAGHAAELKARLLERPSAPEAPVWAAQYAALPEVDRLDPASRAAERIWAARIGLGAGARGSEKKRLREILASYDGCPIDSLVVRRAGAGVARVGVVVPLTGRYARFGKTLANGLLLAVGEHNRAAAPSIGVVLHDSEGDPLVGARKARWLLKDHGVSVLIGEILSANTAPLAAATQVSGAVLLSPSATNERLAILGDAVFQLHLGDAPLSAALARRIARETPRSGAAILAASAPEDSARVAALAQACRDAGVAVLKIERVPNDAVDVTRALTSLRETKAAALILIGSPRLVGVVAPQLASAWPKARVLGYDSLDPEGLNREAKEALEGAVYVAADYALVGAVRDSFEARYGRAYGEPPTRMAVRGYLAGLAVARGIDGGSLNAAMLREALRGQVYDSDEGRTFRALRPLAPAEPEELAIHAGKAAPLPARLKP